MMEYSTWSQKVLFFAGCVSANEFWEQNKKWGLKPAPMRIHTSGAGRRAARAFCGRLASPPLEAGLLPELEILLPDFICRNNALPTSGLGSLIPWYRAGVPSQGKPDSDSVWFYLILEPGFLWNRACFWRSKSGRRRSVFTSRFSTGKPNMCNDSEFQLSRLSSCLELVGKVLMTLDVFSAILVRYDQPLIVLS